MAMPSQISTTSVYNVEYTIPRIVLGVPGRQNAAASGRLRITPGATEPIEFVWGDYDGIPINLIGLTAKLVFWRVDSFEDEEFMSDAPTTAIFAKPVEIKDIDKGLGFVLLTSGETHQLGRNAKESDVRWGLFLVNSDKDVFPCVVSEGGSRWGTVACDFASSLPDIEIIRNL